MTDPVNAAAPAPLATMGDPIRRTESVAKVTGALQYATDMPLGDPLEAYFLTSAIAKGQIASIDTAPAEALKGVVKVYTHLNAPKRVATPYISKGGYVSDTNMPLTGTEIHNDGQIIAMIVADSYETARDASHRVVVRYTAVPPAASLDSPGVEVLHPDTLSEKEKKAGDFDASFASAPVKVDATYSTPPQHQNSLELYSTTAFWSGDQVTIYEPSQAVTELSFGAATMAGIDPAKVHAINHYMGGAFGGKGYMTQRTALIVTASRELGKPVRNVVTRDQGFTLATYRSETKHHIRLAADHSGHLLAYGHESWEMQSRHDDYPVAGFGVTTAMYGKPAIATRVNLVKADRQTSGFMRAPVEMPYMYPLKSAIDELAVALEMDPIELRRINDIRESPVDGARFTSRSLMQCYDQGAASFGWSKRNSKPGSMVEGDWMVGYGCATSGYPTHLAPAAARVTLHANGEAVVEVAGQDSGQGTYTALGQIAARALGLSPQQVKVVMGDSKLPAAPASSNSFSTASLGSAVKIAADKVTAHFGDLPQGQDRAAAFRRLGKSQITEVGEYVPPGRMPEVLDKLRKGQVPFANQARGDESKDGKPLMFAFGAQFVEVRIHRLTHEIRVPRITGAFAAGRIVNPRTARSQLMGGMIWGVSSALFEATEVDPTRGRFTNDSLAEYLIPVSADIPQVDVIMVPEVDNEVNPLGVKGIGELGIVGTAAAIANAVFHATGKRVRDLPITMDKLYA